MQKPTEAPPRRDADADNHKTVTTTRRQWRQLEANNDGNKNILSSKSKQDSECPFKQFITIKFYSHLCYKAELARVLQTINMVSQQWKSRKNDLEGVDQDAFTYRYFTSQCFKCKQKTDGCGFTCHYIYSQKNKCLLIKHLQIPKEGHHNTVGVDKSM